MIMKKHPKFQRPNLSGRNIKKRVKDSWRKPRGIDSKQRQKLKWAGAVVKIGYRSPRSERGKHPKGLPEVLVHNLKELELVKGNTVVIRLGGALSKRNKIVLRTKAKENKMHVVN
ncbi:hypothetical protein KJ765_03200 [Candidatus Micrarchaeota archaeon]|nr:hypothetical protein [Candidatus Micrarchaeota archaeon]